MSPAQLAAWESMGLKSIVTVYTINRLVITILLRKVPKTMAGIRIEVDRECPTDTIELLTATGGARIYRQSRTAQWMGMKTYHWVDKLLTKFGTNPAGKNIYRVVWSEDRLAIEYGKEIRKYGDGKERWILEKWMPPEMYDKAAWEAAVEVVDGELFRYLGRSRTKASNEHC